MKIKIYPIQSSLHDAKVLDETTSSLINELKDEKTSIDLVRNIDDLYKDTDLSLILVQSGGSEGLFLEHFAEFKEPYYLLTYGVNNSLAASLEILAFLRNHNLKGEVLHGSTSYLKSRLHELQKSSKKEGSHKLGVIGKPSDWLISSSVDKDVIRSKFDIELVEIDISEVEEEYSKENEETPETFLNKQVFDHQEVKKAYRLYKALNNLVSKYNLEGFTIRCFDLLTSIKTTSCLALSFFNDKDIIATCEGDIPSMIGMYVVKEVLKAPSFQANPSRINVEKNEILLAHCTIPLKLCDSYSLNTHYESNIGVGIHGEVKLGDCTIFRMNSSFSSCFIEEGSIKQNHYENHLCRTQITVNINNLDKILLSPLGNHELVILGHHKEELLKYLNQRDIKLI